jgi:hypothetical protein
MPRFRFTCLTHVSMSFLSARLRLGLLGAIPPMGLSHASPYQNRGTSI